MYIHYIKKIKYIPDIHHHHHHLSLNSEDHWGTKDDFTTSYSISIFLCPFPDVVFPPLPLSAWSSSPFYCSLQDGFGQTWWLETRTYHCSLHLFTMVRSFSVWSDCLLDLGTDFLIGNMVFVWDVQYLALAPHFRGLYSSLELCCEGPWFISIQDGGCDKGAHQSYFGTEKNTSVIANWF